MAFGDVPGPPEKHIAYRHLPCQKYDRSKTNTGGSHGKQGKSSRSPDRLDAANSLAPGSWITALVGAFKYLGT